MPVDDTDAHPLTQRTGLEPWGCYNKTYSEGYWMKTRAYRPNGSYTIRDVFIRHTMTKDCGTARNGQTDARCAGCKWETGK